jgi:hypothetical protein
MRTMQHSKHEVCCPLLKEESCCFLLLASLIEHGKVAKTGKCQGRHGEQVQMEGDLAPNLNLDHVCQLQLKGV